MHLQAADFFADESAVIQVSKKVGEMVFEQQEAASRLSKLQKSSLSTGCMSPHGGNQTGPDVGHLEQTPADLVCSQNFLQHGVAA